MRVLHVCAYYAPAFVYGGPPRSVHGLCAALQRSGVDVQVLTTDANGDGALAAAVTRAGSYEGVPVRYCPRSWPLQPIGSRALTVALREMLPHTDVLHIHGLWNRVVWAAAREARRAGVPYVLSPRGMLDRGSFAHHAWRKRAAYTLLERRTIESAARIHATSEREAVSIRDWHPSARLVRVPNGIEPSVAASRDVSRLPGSPSVLFVGRLHPTKRLDLLIDAFLRIHGTYPDARLVVAGPDEFSLMPELAARAGRAASAIEWPGEVTAEQRDRLLARADALVLCSDSESFGMSALEAMAAGVPVIVTDTCGWNDVAAEGAGLVVPQRAEAIADAVSRVITHPAEAREMGQRGQALVERKYRWDAIAREFMRTYQEVAAGRAGCTAAAS